MIGRELTNLGISLFVAWLVWRSYRKSSFSPARKYATFWPRFWTPFVDGCILWPVGFVTSLLLFWQSSPAFSVMLALFSNVVGITYAVWMHTRYGQTVGKMACRVRVVDHRTEGPLSVRQAAIRECVPLVSNLGMLGYGLYLVGSGSLTGDAWEHPDRVMNLRLVGALAAMPALWFLVEMITMFSNRKRRALHDLIAGTVVVRTHLDETPSVVQRPDLLAVPGADASRSAQA